MIPIINCDRSCRGGTQHKCQSVGVLQSIRPPFRRVGTINPDCQDTSFIPGRKKKLFEVNPDITHLVGDSDVQEEGSDALDNR